MEGNIRKGETKMIMENISNWFDRLEREQKNKMKKEFEEFSLPIKLGGN